VPINMREQTKGEIKRLLELNIIQKSDSPFNSPALPILKNNGTVRLVIDYRKINANTVSDSFPFPEPMDILADLKDQLYFHRSIFPRVTTRYPWIMTVVNRQASLSSGNIMNS
ncbi:Retrovirus-related Pol polyprotein from transposon opus, partial [Dictyocoela roeselum]